MLKIDGVLHEFSTVPGVKEDVTEIILALKELSATIDGEGSRTLKIEAQGPCTIKGSDIICPPDVEVLSKDLHIATLDENSKFNMEIHVDKGRGYVSAEENKTEHMPIGVLPVDSIYTPVEKVSYHVENTRVGQKSDYDKLILEVWTNGSINPQEGISLAAKVLVEHLNLFIDLTEHVSNVEIMVEKEEDQKEKVLEMTIEELAVISTYQLPIIIFIINNNVLGIIKQWQEMANTPKYQVDLKNPDFVQIANAYSIEADNITSLKTLETKLEEAIKDRKPHLFNINVEDIPIPLPK